MAKRHILAVLSTAVGVAGMLAVSLAQADLSTYISIRTGLQQVDDDGIDGDSWNVENEASRFGFKGSVDIGGGRAMVGRYEFGVDSAQADVQDNNRLSYIGVKGLAGGAGWLYIGRQWSPYYNYVGGVADLYNAVGVNLTPSTVRISRAVIYGHSGDNYGFEIGGQFTDDCPAVCPAGTSEEDPESWNIAGNFKAGPVTIGVGIITDELATEQDVTGVTASLDIGENGYLVVAIESEDANALVPLAEDEDTTTVIYEHKSGKNRFRVSLESQDNGVDLDGTALGWEHKMTDNSRVWIEYEDLETSATTDQTTLSLGFRVDLP